MTTAPTKLEPLPWFAFNIADYVTDTMRLTTEAHGAYLLLMLDYYGTGRPCPDDDFILAAVVKMSEERWTTLRRSLEPLFDLTSGHWVHNRIEREMRGASERHAAASRQRATASAARWSKDGAKEPKRPPDTARAPKSSSRKPDAPPPGIRPASGPVSGGDPQTQTHLTKDSEREAQPSEVLDEVQGIGTPIPRTFVPDETNVTRAHEAGMTDDEIDAEVRKFIGRKLGDGAFSHDWQGSFAEWLERGIAHRAKVAKAPPRIEVNAAPVSSVHAAPTDVEYDRGVAMFAKGMKWSSQLGPEPGQLGCRVPLPILARHGIDPKTGLKIREPAK